MIFYYFFYLSKIYHHSDMDSFAPRKCKDCDVQMFEKFPHKFHNVAEGSDTEKRWCRTCTKSVCLKCFHSNHIAEKHVSECDHCKNYHNHFRRCYKRGCDFSACSSCVKQHFYDTGHNYQF